MARFRDQTRALFAFVAMVISILSSVFVPPATTNAQTDQPYELFYSEQTDYFFFWDPQSWSLEGESSDAGVDGILLSDGEVRFDLRAFVAPGVTPTACLSSAVDELDADPSVLEIEALTAEGGPPQFDGGITELVVSVAGTEGTSKFAVRLECVETVPGESLHLKSTIVPARAFNERGLELWEFDPDFYAHDGFYRFQSLDAEGGSIPVPDETGDIIGTIDAIIPCDATDVFVLAQGLSAERSFLVDPTSFVAIAEAGDAVPASLAVWSLPEARRETSLRLGLGETALIHGVVDADPGHFDLYYSPPVGQAIFLGHSLQGCGAGGGAPVLIDIE